MRDLFAPVAPARRDTSADDARRRAAKAASVPIFASAPSTLQTLACKAERIAAEVERDTVARITARKHEPTLLERRAALPVAIARKTEGAFGVSIPAAELLARVVARWTAEREPVLISPSSLAAATGCTDEDVQRQLGELQCAALLLPVTDAMGRAGWRPDPALLRP